MTAAYNEWLAWAARNERKLGAVLFAIGFFTDFLTFGLLPVGVVVYIFLGYLALAAVCALGAHAFAEISENAAWWHRALSVVFPLGVQYAFGGLLSGLVVFYTAHSVVAASWPFLLFLVALYIGNEYFRMYKHYLVFQTTLFFFTLYAFSVFALPLIVGTLGAWVFVASTAAALAAFALFLYALRSLNRRRFDEEIRLTGYTVGAITAAVCIAYFSGAIPPIPLAMKDGGVYHTLTRVADGYLVGGEPVREWWDPRADIVHVPEGGTLYAYSAVAAPISFSSSVVHRWEYKTANGWRTESRVAFPIAGGREGGYRGYSLKETLAAGQWRVSVETPGGQVIGRIHFDVERAAPPSALIEQTL